MLRGGEDQALLHPTIATGANGVEGFMGFWHNSTLEVKNLMKNECDVIYECSIVL
ncbi:unnamed protein product [Toxocara canis]|uniref:Dirigent protein n=1 Tax=Toxocara canis TaxID=6265 RepID=A0A183ULA4_TOXCA|nr:unnamed protein product [Toxocara canis]